MTGAQLIEAKHGARELPDTEIDYWLRQFDEERSPQYDDLARFGLTAAEQRAARETQALLEEFGV